MTEMLGNAEIAVELGMMLGYRLDYSEKSIASLEKLAQFLHKEYRNGDMQEKTASMAAFAFGAYLGETLLWNGLKDHGFAWMKNEEGEYVVGRDMDWLYPITKMFKRITLGPDHSLTCFYEVVVGLVNGEIDPRKDPRMHVLSDEFVQ